MARFCKMRGYKSITYVDAKKRDGSDSSLTKFVAKKTLSLYYFGEDGVTPMTGNTNMMTYQLYSARIEYDDADGIFFGRIAGIRDGVTFHAETVEGLRAAFREAVDDYTETCRTSGKEPQKAYSGQMMFRVDPEVHRRAALAAELSGKSLNQWAEDVLEKASG